MNFDTASDLGPCKCSALKGERDAYRDGVSEYGRENTCTGQQDPNKGDTPLSLSSEKGQDEPGTSSHQEVEFTSSALSGLMGLCLANSLAENVPTGQKGAYPFSTQDYCSLITSIQSQCLSE